MRDRTLTPAEVEQLYQDLQNRPRSAEERRRFDRSFRRMQIAFRARARNRLVDAKPRSR